MKHGFRIHILIVIGGLLMLQGCYLLKQGSYLLRYTRNAKDNRQVLEDPRTPEATRDFLERVEDINAFARDTLGLEKNRNYTRYVKIDQDFLAWVVSGTGRYSFQPYRWSFPLVGKVPYKGFYEEEDASREAARLKELGYDVWVRKVDAFSTLGYLTDPLYSYMEEYTTYWIANLLIHEQAHATLFLKGQDSFNESFATFVGNTGAKLYIAERFGTDAGEYKSIFDHEADRRTFLTHILELKARLTDLYERSPADMEEKKRAELMDFKNTIQRDYDTLFRTEAYRRVPEIPINNAYLSLYTLYNTDLDLFEAVYELCGRNLRDTVRTIRDAATGSKDGYEVLRRLAETKG